MFSYDPALCCDMILTPLIREPVSSVLSKQWRCGSQETRHSPSSSRGAVSQQCNESHNDAELHVCKLYIWSIKECNDKKQLACLLMKLLPMAHFTEKGPLTCSFRIVLLQFSTLSFSGVGGSLSPCLVFC